MTTVNVAGHWLADGTVALVRSLDELSDDELGAEVALPGWTRRHLLAHLASNADALDRLLAWARTGVMQRMYDSVEQRNAEIVEGAALPAVELRRRVHRTAEDLDRAMASLDAAAWAAHVVTIQGRTIEARELPWLRAREVWVHLVDLQVGSTFDDLPRDFCTALVADVAAWRLRTSPARICLVTPDGSFELADTVDTVDTVVELTSARAAAWLTGRDPRPDLPELAPWI